MSALTLHRLRQTDFATYGRMVREDGTEECKTLELPWRENQHDVSCIPAGTYTAERYFSPHHQCVVFRLLDVPHRDAVEIHVANLPCDLLGCIGVGTSFGHVEKPNGESGDGILGSRTAFHAFMDNHPEQRLTLTIVDPYPVMQEAA